jgi:NAD(P)H-hydrate epimerase
MPADVHANDLLHWQTTLIVRDAEAAAQALRAGNCALVSPGVVPLSDGSLGFAKGVLVRDPDGHLMRPSMSGECEMLDVPETAIAKRFFTDTGIEVPAVTGEQMREVDRIAMAETGPNLYQMMENAGRNLALLALEVLGKGWNTANVVVLTGGGGNGGGGICAARHLANRDMRIKLCLAEPDRLGGVPAFQRKVFQSTSGTEIEAAHVREAPADLILDALIGYGLQSDPRGIVAELIHWANETKAPILALDLPSGVNATTGEMPGACIKPQWTMTLALPKTGLLPNNSGDLFLADIGIPAGTYRRMGLRYVAPFGHRFRVPLTYR